MESIWWLAENKKGEPIFLNHTKQFKRGDFFYFLLDHMYKEITHAYVQSRLETISLDFVDIYFYGKENDDVVSLSRVWTKGRATQLYLRKAKKRHPPINCLNCYYCFLVYYFDIYIQ